MGLHRRELSLTSAVRRSRGPAGVPGTVTGTTASPPDAPVPVATPSDGQVTLDWPDVASANSYKVYQSLTEVGGYSLIASGITASADIADTLVNGTTYWFKVSAVNAGGEGPLSAAVSATPVSSAPVRFTTTSDTRTTTTGDGRQVTL